MRLDLDKNKKYLLACSFGPDSMALYSMLLNEGYNFDVAHVNYHLRKESNYEQESLSQYSSKHNIKFYYLDNKIKITKNIEETCREIRYNYFCSLYQQNKYDALLVAHHQDDLLETYLLQKKRGNLPLFYGLNKISVYQNMTVIRPLLSFTKNELLNYNLLNNVPFATDATNLELNFERNIIRHQVINHLSNESRKELLTEIEDKNVQLSVIQNHINNISLSDFNQLISLDHIEFAYCLTALIRQTIPGYELSLSFANEIKKKLLSKKPNIIIELNRNYQLIKSYDSLLIKQNGDINYSYVIPLPCEFDCPYFYLNFSDGLTHRNISKSDYPITIMCYKPDLKYKIANYSVKINRLFVDWKMPLYLRERWPIILDKNGVVKYIPRYQKNFKHLSTDDFFVKINSI